MSLEWCVAGDMRVSCLEVLADFVCQGYGVQHFVGHWNPLRPPSLKLVLRGFMKVAKDVLEACFRMPWGDGAGAPKAVSLQHVGFITATAAFPFLPKWNQARRVEIACKLL
eukprot:4670980-Alexandrium_andersonii.AAC.1